MTASTGSLSIYGRQVTAIDMVLIAVGLLFMYWPTYAALDKNVWRIVGQGHGPVMLALVFWLAYQRWVRLKELNGKEEKSIAIVLLISGIALYVFGRTQDVMMADVGSQIFVFSALLLNYKGWPGLRVMWFPLFFMLFLLPLPGTIVDAVTAPLKSAVSAVAELLMYKLGFPVGRAGVMLSIGPYKLLVADACAGLNSIFALEAIGVFYMSVVNHASKLRNILLAILILPVSFVSNVVRVMLLVLVTFYYGDEAGQGFVHDFAGIVLFMVATALMIAVDGLLGILTDKKRAK
jgi:exosortase B